MEGQDLYKTTGQNRGNDENDPNHDGRHLSAEADIKQLNQQNLKAKITNFRHQRKQLQNRNITTIKRAKNVFQALHLPKVLNLNPRSAMNKVEHISRFIEEDVAFISKSHDRENIKLEDIFKLETHTVI